MDGCHQVSGKISYRWCKISVVGDPLQMFRVGSQSAKTMTTMARILNFLSFSNPIRLYLFVITTIIVRVRTESLKILFHSLKTAFKLVGKGIMTSGYKSGQRTNKMYGHSTLLNEVRS